MMNKVEQYEQVSSRLRALLAGVSDEIACLSTVSCELFHGMEGFDWVGFYRVTAPRTLTVGPYQGGHGCISISFDRGVCGAAAREQKIQLIDDVNAVADHIACSTSTRSEIVLPVVDSTGVLRAVLDVDSDTLAHFDATDAQYLSQICALLTKACYSA